MRMKCSTELSLERTRIRMKVLDRIVPGFARKEETRMGMRC